MGTGIWNSWGWRWEPYERGTWEKLVENNWKPYQETYQQPCWEPQIQNPFTNPKLATVGRRVCCNLELGTVFNNLSSKALYRNFVGNLTPIEPYIGTLSETLSGNFETPIRNLVGNLKPETRNRKLIGNLVGNREVGSES